MLRLNFRQLIVYTERERKKIMRLTIREGDSNGKLNGENVRQRNSEFARRG